jgi:hypothetical protein
LKVLREGWGKTGLRTASRALGVNANGTYDYPTQLYHWADDETYKSVVKTGNHRIGIMMHDTLPRDFGFDDVNREKVVEEKRVHAHQLRGSLTT